VLVVVVMVMVVVRGDKMEPQTLVVVQVARQTTPALQKQAVLVL